MRPRRSIALGGICLALLLSGCSDDADEDTPTPGERYALEVERITDDLDSDSERALVALNRLADGTEDPRPVAARLDRLAESAEAATSELKGLTPPEAAELSAADLASAAGDIALHARIAATDVRAIERGISTAAAVGRSQARTVLAYQSGFSALSRAVRALAVEAGN